MIEFMIGALTFLAGYLWRIFLERWSPKVNSQHPYSWKCPMNDCDFEVSGSDQKVLDYIAAGHRNYERSK